jgi:hypothetical protein
MSQQTTPLDVHRTPYPSCSLLYRSHVGHVNENASKQSQDRVQRAEMGMQAQKAKR